MRCDLGHEHPTCGLCEQPRSLTTLPLPIGSRDARLPAWVCDPCCEKVLSFVSNIDNLKELVKDS